MQNLLTAVQMRAADAYTIAHQPISSIDLMERASNAFVKVFKHEFSDLQTPIAILCGPGNNGGDGLAIARLLAQAHYQHVNVYLISLGTKPSDDQLANLQRLSQTKVPVHSISSVAQLALPKATIVIDAVFGSGLNKPLAGGYAELAQLVNALDTTVVAVDVPTGFFTEGVLETDYPVIKADLVITFQRPKINFFFPESVRAIYRFIVVDIGLDEDFMERQQSEWKLVDQNYIRKHGQPREPFSHKGTYGHALLIAGNATTMGAALLAAGACLQAGAGLTTLCLPESGLVALNTALPEVMALPRIDGLQQVDFGPFNVVAIGPGLGASQATEALFAHIITLNKRMVIDADGLNILSKRKDLLDQLPAQSILTPHVKEFDRLFGAQQNWWERVKTAQQQAMARNLVIVLKNQYTFCCLPDGQIHINPTGNPAMASGGMGDVLTGIITGLLAQSYPPAIAAILGVYLHGKAGDHLAKTAYVVKASQIIAQLPQTMKAYL